MRSTPEAWRRRRLGPGLALALAAAGMLLVAVETRAETVLYRVDPDHSAVAFSIRHFTSNVPGRFKDFEGTLRWDPQNPAAASVSFTVQAASIDTDNADRDDHLRSADFLDVAKYPTLTFASTEVKEKDAHTLEVMGDLTLHGVTRKVTLPVELLGVMAGPRGWKAGFESRFTLNRKDYGITWNRVLDAGGTLLGDELRITISVEADGVEAIAPAAPPPP